MGDTTLVGVRVHSWQWFKFRKWAESKNLAPGEALSMAIQEFLAGQNISREMMDAWLAEYHQGQHNEVV